MLGTYSASQVSVLARQAVNSLVSCSRRPFAVHSRAANRQHRSAPVARSRRMPERAGRRRRWEWRWIDKWIDRCFSLT